MDPLIVSAELDPALQNWLDELRRAHFPPERLVVGAHLTLFHRLPGDELAAARAACAAAAPDAPLPARATRPVPLGRGVAIRIDAPGLDAVQADLARRFDAWLTPQDRQGFRPHVTVQNKVEPPAARALLDALEDGWSPREGAVVALAVWHYRGGPWELAERFPLG